MTNKRTYISIDEVQPLIPLSRRVPFYYVEYSKIRRKDNDIRVVKADMQGEYSIPVSGIGGLFLGPGTSITSELENRYGCVGMAKEWHQRGYFK